MSEKKNYKRPIIIGVICLVAVVIAWLIFRKVTDWESEKDYEAQFTVRQKEKEIKEARARIERDSIAHAKFVDSVYQLRMGIQTRVEYITQWRTEYVTRFIDTASVATKHRYIDSLLGPEW